MNSQGGSVHAAAAATGGLKVTLTFVEAAVVPKRILIIEDEKALASLLADYLSADGLNVEARADGRPGLEAALSGSFDLVLLDLMLPVMDGFEVCRRLRAERDVPVLILSAPGRTGTRSGASASARTTTW